MKEIDLGIQAIHEQGLNPAGIKSSADIALKYFGVSNNKLNYKYRSIPFFIDEKLPINTFFIET